MINMRNQNYTEEENKNVFAKIIEFLAKDGRVISLFRVFIVFLIAIIIATILYERLPIYVKYSLWGQDSFYAGLVTNMHSSAIDFLVFSIGLYFVMTKHERLGLIRKYKENIDDTRFWFSAEASFKNYANIRRLQDLKIYSIDISKCALIKTKPKKLNLSNSQAMGAVLNGSNFEGSIFSNTSFRGAFAIGANFNNVSIENCPMRYFKFNKGKMRAGNLDGVDFFKAELDDSDFHSTRFKNCNFKEASLKGCNMERADLRQSIELTVEQLLACKSLKYARLDASLEDEIRARKPELLGRERRRP